jgi:hypothetical protein
VLRPALRHQVIDARWSLVAAALAVTVLGCPPAVMTLADAGVDAGVAVPTISPNEACERLAQATCSLKKRCYVAWSREDDGACASNEQARCLQGYTALQASFTAELVRIAPDRVSACVKRMTSSACPPTFPPDHVGPGARPFDDCTFASGLLIGAVPAGEACAYAQECVAGTVCIKPNGVCRGVCSTFPTRGEGCAFGCAPGLTCADDGKCAPLKVLDAPCTASRECEDDLICFAGTCRARRRFGDSCAWDVDRPSPCEPGLACDVVPYVMGAAGTCVRVPLGLPTRPVVQRHRLARLPRPASDQGELSATGRRRRCVSGLGLRAVHRRAVRGRLELQPHHQYLQGGPRPRSVLYTVAKRLRRRRRVLQTIRQRRRGDLHWAGQPHRALCVRHRPHHHGLDSLLVGVLRSRQHPDLPAFDQAPRGPL